jgi:hypothetical protein
MIEIELKFALDAPVAAEQIEILDWSPYALGPRASVGMRCGCGRAARRRW